MKHLYMLILALSVLMLSGCTEQTIETEITETETTSETSATTFNEYVLTRNWDGNELLASIFFLGEYHPLPMAIDDKPDYSYSDGMLYFPDGSYAEAAVDEKGRIISLNLTRESAPVDFSIYGIDFNSIPTDIPQKVGIANAVTEGEDEKITFGFTGGGISQLVFEFSGNSLTAVHVHA